MSTPIEVGEVAVRQRGRPLGSTHREPGTPSSHPVKLNSRHRLLMFALRGGMNQKEAAATLGFSVQRVSQLVNSPLFSREMERMHLTAEDKLTDSQIGVFTRVSEELALASLPAALTLIELSQRAESEQVKSQSARDILDRTGHTRSEKVEVETTVLVAPAIKVAIENAMKRALPAGGGDGE